jgi:hypothetical protein
MTDRNKKLYPIEKILNSPDKGVYSTRGIGGILASLWRQVLLDVNMKPPRFEILLDDFINNAKRGIPEDRVSRHFTRGNLRRELEKETMTFKVFMKGMKFLKIVKINFAVELEHQSGRKTVHSRVVDLGNAQILKEFMSDDKEKENDDPH